MIGVAEKEIDRTFSLFLLRSFHFFFKLVFIVQYIFKLQFVTAGHFSS